jgi:hypothetical protein
MSPFANNLVLTEMQLYPGRGTGYWVPLFVSVQLGTALCISATGYRCLYQCNWVPLFVSMQLGTTACINATGYRCLYQCNWVPLLVSVQLGTAACINETFNSDVDCTP